MSEPPRKDYYGVLRLPPGASPEIVKQRFKRLARQFHPDVNRAPEAAGRFHEIREAYEVLSDPEQRKIVDSWYELTRGRDLQRARRTGAAGGEREEGSGPAARNRPYVARRAPWWATETSDASAGFGCFGLPAAAASFLVIWLSPGGSLELALWVAIAAGLVFGLAATLGGARLREFLLRLLKEIPEAFDAARPE